jgi:hypothetical protein
LRKVGGLFPNTLYSVSGFSLPPIKTDCHNITEKVLSMAKNDENTYIVYIHVHTCKFDFSGQFVFKEILKNRCKTFSLIVTSTGPQRG